MDSSWIHRRSRKSPARIKTISRILQEQTSSLDTLLYWYSPFRGDDFYVSIQVFPEHTLGWFFLRFLRPPRGCLTLSPERPLQIQFLSFVRLLFPLAPSMNS